MKRIITGTIVSAAFSVIVYLAVIYLGGYYLYDFFEVQPAGKVKLDTWINEFYENSLAIVTMAFLGVLIWYSVGYFSYQITDWKRAKGFLAWLLIFLATFAAAFAYGYYFTQPTEDTGRIRTCLIFAGSAALIYWLSTAIFSPPTVKYAPLGSIRLRLASLGNLLVRRLG